MEYVAMGGETFAFSIFDNIDIEIPHLLLNSPSFKPRLILAFFNFSANNSSIFCSDGIDHLSRDNLVF